MHLRSSKTYQQIEGHQLEPITARFLTILVNLIVIFSQNILCGILIEHIS